MSKTKRIALNSSMKLPTANDVLIGGPAAPSAPFREEPPSAMTPQRHSAPPAAPKEKPSRGSVRREKLSIYLTREMQLELENKRTKFLVSHDRRVSRSDLVECAVELAMEEPERLIERLQRKAQ